MRVHWQIFEQDGQTVEAQVFRPDAPSDKLVLFCPGFPGLGASLFEQRHAAALADAGYDVVVIKHAGTRLDTPQAPFAINNAARLQQARLRGESHLGGGASTAGAWLKEPAVVLSNLHVQYADISLIGNSFGAVSALWSLCMGGVSAQHIRRLICFAGAQGVDKGAQGIMRIWSVPLLSNPVIWDAITLDGPEAVSATMRRAYADVAARAGDLPEHIDISYIVVSNDELLTLKDTQDFRAEVMRGRGTIIMDDLESAYPALSLSAHYTPNYPTEKFLELLS